MLLILCNRYLHSLVPRRFGLFTSLSARGTAREGEKRKIDQIDPRGPGKGYASHRTTHSAWAYSVAWVRGWILTCNGPITET
jgi:hypothetical protein